MSRLSEMISALRKCAKEHENEVVCTGQIVTSSLCRDVVGYLEADKWHYPDNGEYLTEPNLCIRYVDRSGDEFIGYTEWYYPSEDEIGYGKQVISVVCNGIPADINDIKMWCELPYPPKEEE